ncbi:putative ATP-binding cassette sub-family G member 2 isoform X2 [Sesbania bispinosa]|nr:putative ATP-binding cassette sub-family G member 2 isoform X2 [Sesbania bispinosa]
MGDGEMSWRRLGMGEKMRVERICEGGEDVRMRKCERGVEPWVRECERGDLDR